MTGKEYGEMFTQKRGDIINVLKSKKIYDMDLENDTYIDLFEYSQHNEIGDFVNAFVEFYQNRYNWQKKQESQIVHYDHAQFAALNIIDESDLEFREKMGQRADAILEYVDNTTFPGERKPELNRKVLHMWLDGMTYEEIGVEIDMDANSVLHVTQRMTKIIRKNLKNMPK